MNDAKAAANTFRVDLRKSHGHDCPFCGVTMTKGPAKGPNDDLSNCTRAHFVRNDHPLRAKWDYIFACKGCNLSQGHLSLDEWLIVLIYRGDRRAQSAIEVVRAAVAAGVLKVQPILTEIIDISLSSEAERPAYTREDGVSTSSASTTPAPVA